MNYAFILELKPGAIVHLPPGTDPLVWFHSFDEMTWERANDLIEENACS